jgi:anhydro-N-acetylmuramic acid kinase
MKTIGLMSGTSADGVDACLAEIRGEGMALAAAVVAWCKTPYPPLVRQRIFNLFREPVAAIRDWSELHVLVGEAFAAAARAVCREAGLPLDEVDLIASHGQTVSHHPPGTGAVPSTLQLGEAAVIAARTGVTVVSNFRPRDMAVGGQGAPLVPFADYILFADPHRTRIVQNIGGIANLTYLRAGAALDDIIAFDTGPGNMVLDALAAQATEGRLECDLDGRLAAAGRVDAELLADLLSHPYFKQPAPKSTGREVFGHHLVNHLWRGAERRGLSAEDILATATAFTAESIARAYHDFLPAQPVVDEVILCGGGADNPVLVQMLTERLTPVRLARVDEFGIPVSAKEALSFAILGYATLHGTPNNVPSATGAKARVVLGQITPGKAGAQP